MKYFVAENTGKGFITHQDNERSHITGYPGNVWGTENNQAWATRVNAVEKTKEEAQALVDAALAAIATEVQSRPQNPNNPEGGAQTEEPEVITLP